MAKIYQFKKREKKLFDAYLNLPDDEFLKRQIRDINIVFPSYFENNNKLFKNYNKSYKKIFSIDSRKKLKKEYDLKDNEIVYVELINDFFFNLNKRIVNLYSETHKLAKHKKFFASMFLLRAFMETAFFDIYITHNLFYKLVHNKMDEFINLFYRANFGFVLESVSVASARLTSKNFKNIIEKFQSKKIHINDPIRYYEKTDFCEFANFFYSEIKKNKLKGWDPIETDKEIDIDKEESIKCYSSVKDFTEKKSEIVAYYRLCEIIHPTAIYFHDDKTEEVITDFKYVYCIGFSPRIYQLLAENLSIKKIIYYKILEKKHFIKSFKKF